MSRIRECTRSGRRAGGGCGPLLLAGALLLSGCARTLPLVEREAEARFPAPAGLPAGLLFAGDTAWALAGDTLWSFLPGEQPRARGAAPPAARLVAAGAERIYLAASGRLHAFSPADDSVRAVSTATGTAAATDPRGRFVLLGDARGAVKGLTPRALLASWAWPRLGGRTLALVVGPHGSRVYQALQAAEGAPATRVLTRDLQTGRLLGEMELRGWTGAAAMGPGGELFLLQWTGEGSELVALLPRGGRMQPLWRRELRAGSGGGMTELAVAGGRLWVGNRAAGEAVVLERGEGELLARTSFPPGGVVAAGAEGVFWVLAEGELLRFALEGDP